MNKIASTLKAAREKKGWSLRETARRSGISAATISKLETGEMENPTFATLAVLSERLGIKGRTWEGLFTK
jgi:transcriptional regulator with XRE-family HTH domain